MTDLDPPRSRPTEASPRGRCGLPDFFLFVMCAVLVAVLGGLTALIWSLR